MSNLRDHRRPGCPPLDRDPEWTGGTVDLTGHDDIPAQITAPAPGPCCTRWAISRGWNHSPECGQDLPQQRYPLVVPPAPAAVGRG
jgi:hypothetical protein